jgi:23S rRNA-/tRNA-specific pseudouridylate synthase
MASIGHPLLGDKVYSGDGTQFEAKHRALIDGQCLFAARLMLKHPRTGEHKTFEAKIPEYFEKITGLLRREIQ